jgi:citrate lyase subunit beta/citryl-CoA lyase
VVDEARHRPLRQLINATEEKNRISTFCSAPHDPSNDSKGYPQRARAAPSAPPRRVGVSPVAGHGRRAEEATGVTDWDTQVLRSLLFAPGNHPRRLEKVGTFGSDAIVLDLEDAVADAEKSAARELVRAALPTYDAETVVVVRVNGEETGRLEDDLRAVVCGDLDCVMVPKVERPETLPRVDTLLAGLEREQSLPQGSIRILALIETARGLVRCEEIAAAAPPRLLTLIFGLGDFSVDIGVDITQTGDELLYGRSRVVVAARAAGLPSPLDGPYLDIPNLEGLDEDCRRSRGLGFQGRVVIYPAHVEPVQRAYSDLSDEEAERCRRVVEAFEEAEAAGSASIQVDGRFVDYPLYHRARQKLLLYEAGRAERAS